MAVAHFVFIAQPPSATSFRPFTSRHLKQFNAIAGSVYPEEYQRFLSYLSFCNLDIGFILSYSCFVTTSFYHRLLISTIGPGTVMAVLLATFFVAKRRNKGREEAIRAVKHKHLSASLFVVFFIYSSVSFTIFQTFVCETLDDGVSYLRADYSLTCETEEYRAFVLYAIIMVCVYPVGVPAALAWWLVLNREDLRKSDRADLAHLEPLSDLWSTYKPSRYYYEVVECGRRIMLTGVAVFVLPESSAQIAIVLLLAVIFVFISESLSPFDKWTDMGLYRWGNGVILASMYTALLLKVDVSEEDSATLPAFVVVLIAANVFLIVTVVVQSYLMVKQWRTATAVIESANPLFRLSTRSSRWPEDTEEADAAESSGQWLGEHFNASSSDKRNIVVRVESGNSRRVRAPSRTNSFPAPPCTATPRLAPSSCPS